MYREVGLMQVIEIIRRWQAGESIRAMAQATGLARNTVGKYVREAGLQGLAASGPAPNTEQVLALARLGETAPPARAAPRSAQLDPHREQIAVWLKDDDLQPTRVESDRDLVRHPGAARPEAWQLHVGRDVTGTDYGLH